MKEKVKKRLPVYLLVAILLLSTLMHIIIYVKHPGSNFVQVPQETLEQMVVNEKISEYEASLKEHTWLYGSRDAYLYAKMANQLIEDGVYGFDTKNTGQVIQNATVTPGQPMLLVALFTMANLVNIEHMTMVTMFNMLLTLLTILLLFLISSKLFKNQWMGVVASAFYATYFSPLHFFRTALTEIPGIFFYVLAIYLFLLAYETNKKWMHLVFAIVFCYGIMIRPVLAPIILFAYALMIWRHRKAYKEWIFIGVVWTLGASLVILPWVIRNYIVFQEFILFSTHSGNSWFAGSNPYNIYSFSDYYVEKMELEMTSKEYAFMKIKQGFETNFSLWFSWFTVGKTYELFKIPDGIYFYQHWSMSWFKLQHEILVIISLISAFLFRKKEILSISAILVMYIALSNLFLTTPRYGFYIMPIMCIISGYAVVIIWTKVVVTIQSTFRKIYVKNP